MQILFVYPGDLDTPTGGYRYDRAIINELEALGHDVTRHSLAGNFPFPSHEDQDNALTGLACVTSHDIAVVDGLAGGVSAKFMAALAGKMPVVALVHHPLCLENGLEGEAANKLKASERQALSHASLVLTTSTATSRTVASLFGFPEDRIFCVLPGVDKGRLSEPEPNGPIRLLCVASIIERKGHLDLITALGTLVGHDWILDCIGKRDFDPGLFRRVEGLAEKLELGERIRFHGALPQSELDNFYHKAHLFVLPSLYEGYGMVYTEAIARGIPVVGTSAGAIPDTVPQGCGLLVKPGDHRELAHALEKLLSDVQLRNRMRDACTKERDTFQTWSVAGLAFASILEHAL